MVETRRPDYMPQQSAGPVLARLTHLKGAQVWLHPAPAETVRPQWRCPVLRRRCAGSRSTRAHGRAWSGKRRHCDNLLQMR